MTKFKDSPEQALADTRYVEYRFISGKYRKYFTSPFEQYRDRVGQKFEIIEPLAKEVYLIKFPDGVSIEAFAEEVCVLDYQNCR